MVAALIALAILVPTRGAEAATAAAAGFVAVSAVCWLLLARAKIHDTESRALWSLGALASGGTAWAPPGDWALDAEAVLLLVTEIGVRGARTVVELGPGASSPLLARAGAGTCELFGLEHDKRFAALVRWHLSQLDLTNYTLLEAPLTRQTRDGREFIWYAPSAVEKLPDRIDALLVDGPPGAAGEPTRAPAWPVLRERLEPGALILVDDTDRWEDRRMVRDWIAGGRLRVLEDRLTFMLLAVE